MSVNNADETATGVYFFAKSIAKRTGANVSTGRYAGAGGLILGALSAFAFSGMSFVKAHYDASVAPRESTVIANFSVSYHSGSYSTSTLQQSSEKYVCAYTFSVDGLNYLGRGCPPQVSDGSLKSALQEGLGMAPTVTRAIVYYDPKPFSEWRDGFF
jgi:hypothetical protein